jgi:pilus assembly protein Flp/PilA
VRRVRDLLRDDRGGTLIEYGLILALIFCVMMVAVHALAAQTTSMYGDITNKVANSSSI